MAFPRTPEQHRLWLAKLPCCVTGDDSAMTDRDVHHLIEGRNRTGKRAPHFRAVPLRRDKHDELHKATERAFAAHYGIDLRFLAGALWVCDDINDVAVIYDMARAR
jgi:hypothetical protein